ncbi:hypothetical protein L486_03098 [Kwoniella mangroviensis CBS 10435]|uniref:Uncharacterized protein n=1 Tax=Kwoniella mangroviensis CBS 10435 TaxID=1331196 RepID=A0A1B9ISU7_9TREE|nr:uncharacterized protein I203_01783 [Kwoniella mangroviensis CBS 8507]OCF58609.1 hypothetical protein L486_03098 [Kwoniella mangroviensis CBS 10435]OCF68401.1 hypothetical protein I203_01783 [Kwoniella mangroviensis CBS 8507]OCF77136.1 hypothetical protein I204_02846 [Kwoniella mangroviensis CBS 8886]
MSNPDRFKSALKLDQVSLVRQEAPTKNVTVQEATATGEGSSTRDYSIQTLITTIRSSRAKYAEIADKHELKLSSRRPKQSTGMGVKTLAKGRKATVKAESDHANLIRSIVRGERRALPGQYIPINNTLAQIRGQLRPRAVELSKQMREVQRIREDYLEVVGVVEDLLKHDRHPRPLT